MLLQRLILRLFYTPFYCCCCCFVVVVVVVVIVVVVVVVVLYSRTLYFNFGWEGGKKTKERKNSEPRSRKIQSRSPSLV